MNIEEGNFTEELAATIKKRNISVITKLVNKLGSDTDDEECLNATAILTELIDSADFFYIRNRKPTIYRLSEIAFDSEAGISQSR